MDNKMKDVIIDNYNFTELDPMRYWSHPSSTSPSIRKAECKSYALSGQFMGARKVDGFWGMLVKDNEGGFHLRSRTESTNGGWIDKAEWIPHICNALTSIPDGTVLLGEVYLPDNEGSRKVTSVLNCLKDKCLERQNKNGYLHFYIFDILAWNGANIMNKGIVDRVKYITDNAAILQTDYTEIAQYKEGEELWNLYGEIIQAGGEGLVITRKDYPYEPKKRKARATVKMKKELQDTIDAFIDGAWKKPTREYTGKTSLGEWQYWQNEKTGQIFTTNQYADYINGVPVIPVTRLYALGYAAAISFSVMDGDKPIHIGWISGIPDSMRSAIVNDPSSVINDVYELTAMETEHIGEDYSLRHGKIVQRRTDKTPADCLFSQITN